jgi:hypothetical protein
VSNAQLRRALAAIDVANAEDPVRIRVRGEERPKEQAHAEMMSEWVTRLDPNASEALLLAARAHHVRRWEIPRSSYPDGRKSYLEWRRALHGHHAAVAAEILEGEGYGAETIERVGAILHKRGLGRDPEIQVFEDALCLIFLETQLADFSSRYADKLEGVARKTLKKMSDQGIAQALALPLPEGARDLLTRVQAEPQ